MIGKRKFSKLARLCFAQHLFNSPFFRDLPKALVDYLNQLDLAAHDLPPYSAQLAHYEWAELAVSHLPTLENKRNQPPNLLDNTLTLTPAHMLVHYAFPVHRLSKRHPHSAPEPTFMLIHRNADQHIKFTLLNAVTYQLLLLIQQGLTGREALSELAQVLNQPIESMVTFGQTVLEDLQQQGVFCEYVTE